MIRLLFLIVILSFLFNKTLRGQCSDVPVQEAVVNGDFEAGNLNFSSDLTFKSPSCTDNSCWSLENQYLIGDSEKDLCFDCSMATTVDHTTGTGNMMLIDGPNNPNVVIWEQTVNVIEFQTYYFSAWVARLISVHNNPPQVQFFVDGVALGPIIDFTADVPGVWRQIYGTVYIGGGITTAHLQLISQRTTGVNGNDFAVDDISFINGCQNVDNGTQPDLGADQNICETNGSITLNSGLGAGTGQFFWYSGTGVPQATLVDNDAAANTYTVTEPGTYRVCFQDGINCAASSEIVISREVAITIPDGTLNCHPTGTTPLTATGTAVMTPTYTWSVPAGMASPGNAVTANADRPGTYTVSVSSISGTGWSCTATDEAVVTLNNNMSVTLSDEELCSPTTATLDAGLAGGNISYSWSVPGGATDPGNAQTTTANVSGNYAVTVTSTSAAGWTCTVTDNATITSNLPPTAAPSTQCHGTSVAMTNLGTGPNAANFVWYDAPGGTVIGTGPSPTITFPGAGASHTVYVVDETLNPLGGSPIETAALSSYGDWSNSYMDLTISQSVRLENLTMKQQAWTGTCAAAGTFATVDIQLRQGGSTLNTRSVTLTCGNETSVTVDFDMTPGNYQVRIVGTGGNNNPTMATSAFAFTPESIPGYITATGVANNSDGPFSNMGFAASNACDPLPVVIPIESCCDQPTINSLSANTPCAGETLNISLTATANGGASIDSYSWAGPNNFSTSDEDLSIASVTVAADGTYTVTISDDAGCDITTSVDVTVNAVPTANAGGGNAICPGEDASLTASGGGTYLWSGAMGTNASISPSPTTTTTFTVTVTTNGCEDTDEAVVTVNTMPTADAGNDDAICPGENASLTASGGGTYQWSGAMGTNASISPSPTVTTTYTVTVTLNGCADTDDVLVTVNAFPTANAGSDDVICPGENASLSASGGGTYLWSGGMGTTASISPSPAVTTTYTITVTSNGCADADDAVVTVNTLPTANPSNDGPKCAKDTVQLTSGTNGDSYAWAGPNSFNSNDQNPLLNSVTVGMGGVYTVTVMLNGCSDVAQTTVTVNPNPTPNAGGDENVCKDDPLNLSPTSNAQWNYLWSAGTEVVIDNPASATTSVSYANPGALSDNVDVQLNLLVTNTVTGCQGKDSLTVTFEFVCNPYVNVKANKYDICLGDSVRISADTSSIKPINAFQWSVTAWGDDTGYFWVSPVVTTTYTATITDNTGKSNSDKVVIVVHSLPVAEAGNNQHQCVNSTTNLTESGGEATDWQWSHAGEIAQNITVGPTDTSTYYVTISDINGCTNIDSVVVYVIALPEPAAGGPLRVCKTDPLNLAPESNANWDYLWSSESVGVIDDPNLATTTVSYTDPTALLADTSIDFYLQVTDKNYGCMGRDTTTVTFEFSCKPHINIYSPDSIICIGDSTVLFADTASSKPVVSVVWSNPAWNDQTGPIVVMPVITTTYSAVITDSLGRTDSDTLVITVNGLPAADLGNNVNQCINGSTNLFESGGQATAWVWSTSETAQNIQVAPTVTTTYSVTVTDSNDCKQKDSVTVIVRPLPNANAGPDLKVCKTLPVKPQISGTTGWTYTWTTGTEGLIDNPSIYNPNLRLADTVSITDDMYVDFYLKVRDSYFCEDIDTMTVQFEFQCKPYVYTNADKNPICLGDTVTITGYVSSSKPIISYSWNDGVTDTVRTESPTTTTTYIVSVEDSDNKTDEDTLVLVVNQLPTVNITKDTAICLNQSTPLTATGAQDYSWNHGTLTGTTNVSPVNTTTYAVTGTDINGCTDRDTVNVTVHPLPVPNPGADTLICGHDSATLTGYGGDSFLWNTTATTQTIVVKPAINTTYTLTVTDANNCSEQGTIVVGLQPPASPDAGNSQDICFGADATLQATGGNVLWSNASNNNPATVSPTVTSTYTVTVTSAEGCTGTDNTVVSVHTLPVADAGSDAGICANENTSLAGQPGGMSLYEWQGFTPGQNIQVSPATTTDYILLVTDAWDCTDEDTVTITVHPLPVVTFSAVADRCVNAPAAMLTQASANAPGAGQYSGPGVLQDGILSPSVANVGLHSITYTFTDTNNCVNSATATANILSLPDATIGDQEICLSDSTTLSATTTSLSYTWSTSETTSSIQFMATDTGTFSFSLVVSNTACSDTGEAIITVHPTPVINLIGRSGCQPYTALLTAQSNPAFQQLLWDFGDANSSSNTAVTASGTVSHSYQQAGLFDIRIMAITEHNCTTTTTFNQAVSVNDIPVGTFTFSPAQPTTLYPEVDFKAVSKDSVKTWYWHFSDEESQDNKVSGEEANSTRHVFTSHGTYPVTMVMEDYNGCIDSVTIPVHIKPDHVIFVPNAFTPNYDGRNDKFFAEGVGISDVDFNFYVYTRWGEEIFHGESKSQKWDGTKNGILVPVGVYQWVLYYQDLEKNQHKLVGLVSVLY